MDRYKRGELGFPLDPELRRLEIYLSDLAAAFRGTRGMPDKQMEIVQEYHATLSQLYALGWNDSLDEDSKLPKRLMPEEYFRRVALLREEYLRRSKQG